MKWSIMRRIAIGLLLIMVVSVGIPTDAEVQAAKSATINKKKIVLKVGQRCRLKVKGAKKKARWKSLKKKVATVSKKGMVKARKKGTAKIVAIVGKKRLVCKVVVQKKDASHNPTTQQNGAATNVSNDNASNANGTNAASSESPSQATAAPTPVVDQTEVYQQKVFELVNAQRASQGVAPLVLDPALCQVAMLRAEELTETFSHTRPNGSLCFTAIKEAGISYMAAAENIATGQSTPAAVMNSWMNSSGHRGNILSGSYGKIGVGYVSTSNGLGSYWVQIFTN